MPLDIKKSAALGALLSERTIVAAASKAGISERTLQNWLHDDLEFQEAYETACQLAQEAAFSHLQLVADRAISTLEENLGARKASDRSRAAAALLFHLERLSEKIDVSRRIRELERKIVALKHKDAWGVVG